MKKETVFYYEPPVTTCETTPYHILRRRPRCKISSCIMYSSNYRYHQINIRNIRNVCILPTKSVLYFPCDLQKTAIISRFHVVTAIMQVFCVVTLCPWMSVARITKEHIRRALKRRETLTQRHCVIFSKIWVFSECFHKRS
jgi:hypothetical protein